MTSDPLVFHSTVSADTSASISCVPDHDIFTSVWSNWSFLHVPQLFSVTSFLLWTRTTGIKLLCRCDVTAEVISVAENLFFFNHVPAVIHALYSGRLPDSVACQPLLPSLIHIHLEAQFSNSLENCANKRVGCASKYVLSETGVFSPLIESLKV